MGTALADSFKATATCDKGHRVMVVIEMGVARNYVHRYPTFADPVSGRLRERKCPACEATAKMLAHARGWGQTELRSVSPLNRIAGEATPAAKP